MIEIAGKLLIDLGMKLLTQTVVSRLFVHTAQQIAESTENKLDDKWVADIAAGLGVPISGKID